MCLIAVGLLSYLSHYLRAVGPLSTALLERSLPMALLRPLCRVCIRVVYV